MWCGVFAHFLGDQRGEQARASCTELAAACCSTEQSSRDKQDTWPMWRVASFEIFLGSFISFIHCFRFGSPARSDTAVQVIDSQLDSSSAFQKHLIITTAVYSSLIHIRRMIHMYSLSRVVYHEHVRSTNQLFLVLEYRINTKYSVEKSQVLSTTCIFG